MDTDIPANMTDNNDATVIEEEENVRPKRSFSISSTENTPAAKRRRTGTRPVCSVNFRLLNYTRFLDNESGRC
jgi:hypothetical protein